jgi:hypothetical protein
MRLVDSVGLVTAINERARVLKKFRPYRDSDHVLNIALNLLCGGEVLDDIEIRRNDRTFLDALGARAIPDPTTAGDYLRRLDEMAVWRLMHAVNHVRVGVWQRAGIAQDRTPQARIRRTRVPPSRPRRIWRTRTSNPP